MSWASVHEQVIDIAQDAAALVLAGWRTGAKSKHKGEIDLVTEYDLRSEDLVRTRLGRAFPDWSIVAEEGGGEARSDHVWYVDPLDGTTNFAHGHPFFCVSIGLWHQGMAVVGVVCAPALATTWSARAAGPTSRNGTPCRVSEVQTLQDALLATGFPYDRRTTDENNFREFVHLKRRAQGIRRCGSAALDLALVADGTYDGYWEQKLRPWDLCAGAALVQGAGGRLSGYDGAACDVRSGQLVASNGVIHEALLQEIAAARAS